jgi:hypothetical protein
MTKPNTDFFEAQKYIYEPLGWKCNNVKQEAESQEYGACSFEMNGKTILFRVSKITPTKVGQFVTLWKRIGKGPIQPYDMQDSIDLFVVSVRNKNSFGQFVFPKAVLCEKGIVSQGDKVGKLAIRVYPAWDIADNSQAKKTQAWQLNYFFEVKENKIQDSALINKLYFR